MLQIYKFIVDKKTKGRSFILFFCLMLATTVSLAQNGAKITIKKNSISVIEALKEVEKQSGMSVGYNDSQLKNKPAITLNIETASLENALAQMLNLWIRHWLLSCPERGFPTKSKTNIS